jgi:hypothetical protein
MLVRVIARQAAGGHNAANTKKADLGAEMFGVCGNFN